MFDTSQPMFLHSDKKHKSPVMVREYTLSELKTLSGHCLFVTRFGDLATVKVTSVKTWKRRLNDVTIGLKYGMYEYFKAEYVNGVSLGEQLVKVIDTESIIECEFYNRNDRSIFKLSGKNFEDILTKMSSSQHLDYYTGDTILNPIPFN